jgi:V/A-type H+-transporting ATPase subunit I
VILRMSRVEVLGPRDAFGEALAFLQTRGVLELRVPTDVAGGRLPAPPEPGGADDEGRLQEALRRIDALAARLPPARAGPAEVPPPPGSDAMTAWLAALEEEAGRLEARRAALLQEREATARFGRLVVALAPLGHRLDAAQEPEVHGVVLRTDPATLSLLEAEVARLTGGAYDVKARPLDAESTGVLLVVPHAHGRAVASLLFERGVDEVRLPSEYAGKRLVDVLLLLAARERTLPGEIARADEAFAAFAKGAAASLAVARVAVRAAQDRRRAAGSCGQTRFTFVVAGYMPEERVDALRAAAAGTLGDRVAVLARAPTREEWDEVPVVLRNRASIRPFERLLALVPLPRYGSIDPTPWLALFFPLFFGLVLGDVAFGALGICAALLVRWRKWGGGPGRDFAAVALWCSLSAVLFGVLFGEALGELGAHVGMRPLVLDRRHAVMTFFAAAVAIGGVHVAAGMVLGVTAALRRRRVREAAGRGAKLLLLVSAALVAGASAGVLPPAILVPAVGAGGAFLVVAVVAEGPLAALELVLALGNVLSYARLMALGLASVMLAEVANLLAETIEPAVAGLALGVLLHAVNFSLGLISPTIAALRLHYVEFFDKFYDEGGAPYRPFALSGWGK